MLVNYYVVTVQYRLLPVQSPPWINETNRAMVIACQSIAQVKADPNIQFWDNAVRLADLFSTRHSTR